MSKLIGKWRFIRNDNMEAFFDALEFTDDMKTTFLNWKPSIEITQSGGNWTMKHSQGAGLPDFEAKFKLGEEIENPSPTGVMIKSIFTLDEDQLTERQIRAKGDIIVVREVVDDHLNVKVTLKGVTGTTYFSKE